MYTAMTGTSLTKTTQPTMNFKSYKQNLAMARVCHDHRVKGNLNDENYSLVRKGMEDVIDLAMTEKGTTFTFSQDGWFVMYIRDKKKWKEDEDFLLTAIKGDAVFYETGDES
jgi:hypothetical protein